MKRTKAASGAYGADATTTPSLDTLRPGGLLVAVPSGVSPELLEKAGSRGCRATAYLVEPDGHVLGEIARLIDSGVLLVEVEEVFPLEKAAEAHRHVESGRTRGKLVLRVAP
ncbi:zinc-binding dehydrogenase [Streptomyces sp. ISL-99]|uniref:zinc-binding dehydrogenase n=1 Tax=Streptomyces sp. ISL-99 TaxID=2819193 RepID=UPI0035B0FE24